MPSTGVPFIAQSWRFENGPSMVFVAGEVCIDFQLRIKRDHEATVWPIANANATPCYIDSRRMLATDGYEAGNSMFLLSLVAPPAAQRRRRRDAVRCKSHSFREGIVNN